MGLLSCFNARRGGVEVDQQALKQVAPGAALSNSATPSKISRSELPLSSLAERSVRTVHPPFV